MFGRVQTAANWNFHLTIKIKKITWTHLRTTVSDWVNVRAKWNGSWIGHTTKLWPSILCKVLWYKIFILHNLIFIIDHQQHTSTLQNTKESFHQNWRKEGNIHHHNRLKVKNCPLVPWIVSRNVWQIVLNFEWMNNKFYEVVAQSQWQCLEFAIMLNYPYFILLALLFLQKFRNNNLFQAINFYSSLTFTLFIFHILLLFLWSNVKLFQITKFSIIESDNFCK